MLNSEFINNGIYVNGFFNIRYNSFICNSTVIEAELPDYVSIENNWWGVSNPNWDTILSANLTYPNVYAVLNTTFDNATYEIISKMYWNGNY